MTFTALITHGAHHGAGMFPFFGPFVLLALLLLLLLGLLRGNGN